MARVILWVVVKKEPFSRIAVINVNFTFFLLLTRRGFECGSSEYQGPGEISSRIFGILVPELLVISLKSKISGKVAFNWILTVLQV